MKCKPAGARPRWVPISSTPIPQFPSQVDIALPLLIQKVPFSLKIHQELFIILRIASELLSQPARPHPHIPSAHITCSFSFLSKPFCLKHLWACYPVSPNAFLSSILIYSETTCSHPNAFLLSYRSLSLKHLLGHHQALESAYTLKVVLFPFLFLVCVQ